MSLFEPIITLAAEMCFRFPSLKTSRPVQLIRALVRRETGLSLTGQLLLSLLNLLNALRNSGSASIRRLRRPEVGSLKHEVKWKHIASFLIGRRLFEKYFEIQIYLQNRFVFQLCFNNLSCRSSIKSAAPCSSVNVINIL